MENHASIALCEAPSFSTFHFQLSLFSASSAPLREILFKKMFNAHSFGE